MLQQATGDETYREATRQTLSAYVEANRGYGEFAASYALAVDLFLNRPVEITVEGHREDENTLSMLRAAAQVPYPNLVLKMVETGANSPVQAHICLDTVCLPPVSDPDGLAPAVAEALTPQENPFGSIFEQFGGL